MTPEQRAADWFTLPPAARTKAWLAREFRKAIEMEEVLSLESVILTALRGKIGDKGLRADAQAMLTKCWLGPGTRLDALKEIVKRLKLPVDT